MLQNPEHVEQPALPHLRRTGERIDELIEAVAGGAAGPPNPTRSRERAEELVRVVTDLYGAGLERLLEILYDSGRLDDELLRLLADDDLVASLLLVHGLHPYDVRTRVEQALDSVRPYLGSHGGDVELLEVTDAGAVQLRLLGSCDGCPSSSVTLELAVQDAIEAAAPEITSIDVEAPTPEHAGGPLIPVDSLRARLGAGTPQQEAGATWHTLPAVAGLSPGQAVTLTVGGSALFVCRVGTDLFAFRDACGRCGSGLEGAVPARRLGGAVGDAVLTCPGCGAHYDVRRAGACLDAPDLHLDPLPLLADGATVSVALPALVGP
jgi:Fe-S cluster biogenesis protein NfuA/nitrite reductase/ring-hydroxylating ferredoxin subunit